MAYMVLREGELLPLPFLGMGILFGVNLEPTWSLYRWQRPSWGFVTIGLNFILSFKLGPKIKNNYNSFFLWFRHLPPCRLQ